MVGSSSITPYLSKNKEDRKILKIDTNLKVPLFLKFERKNVLKKYLDFIITGTVMIKNIELYLETYGTVVHDIDDVNIVVYPDLDPTSVNGIHPVHHM